MLCDTAAFQKKKDKKESDAAYNPFPGTTCVHLGGPGLSLREEIALARYAAAD